MKRGTDLLVGGVMSLLFIPVIAVLAVVGVLVWTLIKMPDR